MTARDDDDGAREGRDFEKVLHPGVREVYRDDVLWVLDKPAGILSHPNSPSRAPNALFRAPYEVRDECFLLGGRGGAERKVWLVHRLDQDTSGLIVCTFDPGAAATLKQALYEREVHKEYIALLVGRPERPHGEWEDHLEKRPARGRAEVRIRRSGPVNAKTQVRVQRIFEPAGLTLVSLIPETGRTHQLRVQAAGRGTPIAGDDRYGDFAANRFLTREIGLRRMFLHASRLELRHPTRGHRLRFHREIGRQLGEPLSRLESLACRVPRRGG